VITLYSLKEWRGKQRTSPLGDKVNPWGQSSPLGVRLKTGLWSYVPWTLSTMPWAFTLKTIFLSPATNLVVVRHKICRPTKNLTFRVNSPFVSLSALPFVDDADRIRVRRSLATWLPWQHAGVEAMNPGTDFTKLRFGRKLYG
jgi:hypothetical protein